ncbi:uncharacterized protein [Dermacentor albipictus]|uniref:uncharacterized protein isoform X3 n=1 Tax=Dermacentor albipictus TaxID=60249 RepID=UPI0031FE3DB0
MMLCLRGHAHLQLRAAALWLSLMQLLPASEAATPTSTAPRCICFVKLSSDQSPWVLPQPGVGSLRCAAAEPGLLRCRWRSTPCGRVRRPPGLYCFGNAGTRSDVGGKTEEQEPWRLMDASQRYLACVFGTCGPACAFCTRVQPGSGIGVSLRSVEYSPFLVGVEWRRVLTFASLAATLRRRRPARRYRIGVTTCWSWKEQPCTLRCGPEEPVSLSGPAGSFSVPADLYSGSVQLRVRGLGRDRPGAAVFRAYFHRKQVEPSSPCDVTVRTLGWSVVRLSWKARPHAQLDGFQVHWCRADSTLSRGCSQLHLPRNVSSVVLMGLVPFLRYTYRLRSFRGDPNSSDVLFSLPTTATRRDRLSFELFLYTEMLVVFLLAGALTLVALLTIGFILMRALGLTTFLDMEPNEMAAGPGGARENQAQGDHRRHVPGGARRRRGPAALPRVRSRGDS